MFKAERLQSIKEIIFERRQVEVATLSMLLNVSEVTIRSDLEKLERQGFIYRTHGGATLNEEHTRQNEINDAMSGRSIQYNSNKESIGKIASSLIQENEWVFLGPGSTCYYIAKALTTRKNVNILTNNVYVVNILSSNPYANVLITGGILAHTHCCMIGDLFNRSIENLFFSKAFFTVGGVDFKGGYTVSSAIEMDIFKAVVERSKDLILTIDHTKFDKLSFMKIGDLDIAQTIVSNENIPKEYKSYYFEKGIKIFTSYELDSSIV
jgi:Transcriptional regulators of sugar metabolism